MPSFCGFRNEVGWAQRLDLRMLLGHVAAIGLVGADADELAEEATGLFEPLAFLTGLAGILPACEELG